MREIRAPFFGWPQTIYGIIVRSGTQANRELSYMYRTIVTDKLEPGLLEHTDEFFCNKRPSSIMDTNSIYYK